MGLEQIEEFEITQFVAETLKPLEIPVFFASKGEVTPPVVLFNIVSEKTDKFWDDEEQVTKYQVGINIFTTGNFLKFKKQIIDLMTSNGFFKEEIIGCIYQEDVGLYNQPLTFTYYKNCE